MQFRLKYNQLVFMDHNMTVLGKRENTQEHTSVKRQKQANVSSYPERCIFGDVVFSKKIALVKDFRNERKAMRFFSQTDSSRNDYLSIQEQNAFQVIMNQKPMCFPNGEILNGLYNFCLTCEENPRLLCSPTHHHSFLSNGKKVLGIGTLTFEQGQLLEISNHSGHYRPSNDQMIDTIKALHYESEDELKVYVSYSKAEKEVFAVSQIIEAESFSSLKPLKKNQTINLETGEIEKIKHSNYELKDNQVTFLDCKQLVNRSNQSLNLQQKLQIEYASIVSRYNL